MRKLLQLNQHIVYGDNILNNGFDNTKILKTCETNLHINKKDPSPGEQTKFYIINDEFLNFQKIIFEKIKSFLKVTDDKNIFLDQWVYKSSSKNTSTRYHRHDIGEGNLVMNFFIPSHTLTYYISMPNNDEGLLWFKEDDEEISYQPTVGDILIFPANLKHKPDLNKNSSVDRVVYGANFCLIDEDKIDRKTKTLI